MRGTKRSHGRPAVQSPAHPKACYPFEGRHRRRAIAHRRRDRRRGACRRRRLHRCGDRDRLCAWRGRTLDERDGRRRRDGALSRTRGPLRGDRLRHARSRKPARRGLSADRGRCLRHLPVGAGQGRSQPAWPGLDRGAGRRRRTGGSTSALRQDGVEGSARPQPRICADIPRVRPPISSMACRRMRNGASARPSVCRRTGSR